MNYVTNKVYYNRYRVPFSFETMSDSEVELKIPTTELMYCRYGGKEGEEFINYKSLGFIDPSGGPFLPVGGFTIDKKNVVNLSVNEKIIFTVI